MHVGGEQCMPYRLGLLLGVLILEQILAGEELLDDTWRESRRDGPAGAFALSIPLLLTGSHEEALGPWDHLEDQYSHKHSLF